MFRFAKAMLEKARDASGVRVPHGVFLGDDRVLTTSANGFRLFVDSRDIMLTPLMIIEGEWEPRVAECIEAVCNRGDTFIDVGANIGYFTCLASRCVGRQGRVVSFEPDPRSYELLVDNVNVNWFFEGVETHELAVSNTAGNVTLCRRGKYQANTSLSRISSGELERVGDTQEEIRVASIVLDDFVASRKLRVDVIKIDVEGAEHLVLGGMEKLVSSTPDLKIILEWSPGQLDRLDGKHQVLEWLQRFAWDIQHVEDGYQHRSCEDLLSVSHGTLLLTR